jgi:hypothetical protein
MFLPRAFSGHKYVILMDQLYFFVFFSSEGNMMGVLEIRQSYGPKIQIICNECEATHPIIIVHISFCNQPAQRAPPAPSSALI